MRKLLTLVQHRFMDKNNFGKRDIVMEFENLINTIDKDIKDNNKQLAYDFLQSASNIHSK